MKEGESVDDDEARGGVEEGEEVEGKTDVRDEGVGVAWGVEEELLGEEEEATDLSGLGGPGEYEREMVWRIGRCRGIGMRGRRGRRIRGGSGGI